MVTPSHKLTQLKEKWKSVFILTTCDALIFPFYFSFLKYWLRPKWFHSWFSQFKIVVLVSFGEQVCWSDFPLLIECQRVASRVVRVHLTKQEHCSHTWKHLLLELSTVSVRTKFGFSPCIATPWWNEFLSYVLTKHFELCQSLTVLRVHVAGWDWLGLSILDIYFDATLGPPFTYLDCKLYVLKGLDLNSLFFSFLKTL